MEDTKVTVNINTIRNIWTITESLDQIVFILQQRVSQCNDGKWLFFDIFTEAKTFLGAGMEKLPEIMTQPWLCQFHQWEVTEHPVLITARCSWRRFQSTNVKGENIWCNNFLSLLFFFGSACFESAVVQWAVLKGNDPGEVEKLQNALEEQIRDWNRLHQNQKDFIYLQGEAALLQVLALGGEKWNPGNTEQKQYYMIVYNLSYV